MFCFSSRWNDKLVLGEMYLLQVRLKVALNPTLLSVQYMLSGSTLLSQIWSYESLQRWKAKISSLKRDQIFQKCFFGHEEKFFEVVFDKWLSVDGKTKHHLTKSGFLRECEMCDNCRQLVEIKIKRSFEFTNEKLIVSI